MAQITLKGNPIITAGELPKIGSTAPAFILVKSDLADTSLKEYAGRKVVLNIFPSLDTGICATSVRTFNSLVSGHPGTTVLCVSADLPFAAKRFCTTEGLENVVPASCFRNSNFGVDYGVTMLDGPLKGLLSRAIVVIDEKGKVAYTQQVPEIGTEPDYNAAMAALK